MMNDEHTTSAMMVVFSILASAFTILTVMLVI